MDDTHPLVGGQRQAASPAASLHEAQGARDGVNRAGASPSCSRTCVADGIALLLADMETIRADASPSAGCTPPLSAQIWPPTEIVLWIALAVSHHGRWLEKGRLTV